MTTSSRRVFSSWPISVGGVEKVHADVDGVVQHGQRGRVIGRAVEIGHAHAAQAQGGDFEIGVAQAAAGNEGAHAGNSSEVKDKGCSVGAGNPKALAGSSPMLA